MAGNKAMPPLPAGSPKPANFKQYVDPSGELGTRSLQLGLWLARHKMRLYRVGRAFLLAVTALLWVFSLWSWGGYLLVGISRDQALERAALNFPNYLPSHVGREPLPLEVLNSRLLQGGVRKVDAVAEVTNPNPRWVAKFSYRFVIGGEPTPAVAGVLLPGESRPLVVFGLVGDQGRAPVLEIDNIFWQRISTHQVPDPLAWQAERMRLTVSAVQFQPAGADPEAPLAQVIRFNLFNDSPYGYRTLPLVVGLYLNQTLVAALPLTLEQLAAQETRAIDLRSFVSTLNADSVQVFPLVNLYDRDVYLPPGS